MPANQQPHVVLFGGNGFAGTHIAECLVNRGAQTVCVSRSGTMPQHLRDCDWASQVEWLRGDACEPEPTWFEGATAIIALVGAPPLPTFSKAAFARQLNINSAPNSAAMAAAKQCGVQRVVLMGAQVPRLLQSDKFAYWLGKQRCLHAAEEFAATSPLHTATVLQPGAMYGTRHTKGGLPIPLALVMAPLATLMPGQFISVKQVAAHAAAAALGETGQTESCHIITQAQLQQAVKRAE